MKKTFLTIFAVLMTCTYAFAETGSCGDNCSWTFNSATQTLTISGKGAMWVNSVEGGTGHTHGYYKDEDIRDNIKHIIVEDGITQVGDHAFYLCDEVEDVQLPNSLVYIWHSAFNKCSSLKSIYIPASVTNIYPYTFAGCTSLTKIVVDPNNKVFDSRYSCNGIIKTATNELLAGCQTTRIPDGITTIGASCFGNLPIKEINIPEGVTRLDPFAFEYCEQLKTVTLPSTLATIDIDAFCGCIKLESIVCKATTAPECKAGGAGEMEVFLHVNKDNCTITTPKHRDSRTYLTADGWKDFQNIVQVDMNEYEESLAARKLCDTNEDGLVNAADVVRIYNFIIDGK